LQSPPFPKESTCSARTRMQIFFLCLSECVCVWQVPPPSLGHDMAQLLESGQAADVRFKVEEEELAAHKFILTARSPVFRSVASTLFILSQTRLSTMHLLSCHLHDSCSVCTEIRSFQLPKGKSSIRNMLQIGLQINVLLEMGR